MPEELDDIPNFLDDLPIFSSKIWQNSISRHIILQDEALLCLLLWPQLLLVLSNLPLYLLIRLRLLVEDINDGEMDTVS
jgi:hypothetical protein